LPGTSVIGPDGSLRPRHNRELVTKATADGDTTYAYDNRGLLTSMTDPPSRTTAYGCDSAGRVASVTGPDSRVWSYTYDAGGRTKSVTDTASE
jgi:YD repeat-containing protein